MNIIESLRLDMFNRVHQFSIDSADCYAASTRARELFDVVEGAIEEIKATAAAQSSGINARRQKTVIKRRVRGVLLEQMIAINRLGRAISLQIPGVLERFPVPARHSDQTLLIAARAFASDALPLKAEFVARGLPDSFLEELDRARQELADSINERHSSRDSHIAATAAIGKPFERGTAAVLELRLIMPSLLKRDPAALAGWRSASHTERH